MVKTFQNLVHFNVKNSPNAPLWNNYRFTLNGKPFTNDEREAKGISTLDDLGNIKDRKLRTFAQLKALYGIEDEILEIHANKVTTNQISRRSSKYS